MSPSHMADITQILQFFPDLYQCLVIDAIASVIWNICLECWYKHSVLHVTLQKEVMCQNIATWGDQEQHISSSLVLCPIQHCELLLVSFLKQMLPENTA